MDKLKYQVVLNNLTTEELLPHGIPAHKRANWLREHVGDEGIDWDRKNIVDDIDILSKFEFEGRDAKLHNVYIFKEEAEAILFKLTWG